MPFHRNDSHGKVAEHCKENNVHFEYTHHSDREKSVFHSALNLIALRRRFKNNIITKGGKGADEQAKADEEARKRIEDAQRLAQEAAGWLHTKEEEKEKLCKKQLERQKKKQGNKKKKRKGSSMRSYKSKK